MRQCDIIARSGINDDPSFEFFVDFEQVEIVMNMLQTSFREILCVDAETGEIIYNIYICADKFGKPELTKEQTMQEVIRFISENSRKEEKVEATDWIAFLKRLEDEF